MDKVSIVLCSYNGEKYIQEQLDCICAQTYPNIEIIVQDDGSSDNTVAIVWQMQEKEPRIQLFCNPENLGFNRNFESAICKATGTWIALCDQDDIWMPTKISDMMNGYDGHSILIHCDSYSFQQVPDYTYRRPKSFSRFSGTDARKIFIRNTIEGHNILFHRRLLEYVFPFPENIYFDWWLGYCAAVCGGVQWNRGILVWRRLHPNNATDGQEKKVKELIHTYQAFVGYIHTPDLVHTFGNRLIYLLEKKKKKHLFFFLWKYRKIVFFFSRKPLSGKFSYLKKIYRLLKELQFIV